MTDIAGLIERLRMRTTYGNIGDIRSYHDPLCMEAAEALARLVAELVEADKLAVHHSDRADKAEARDAYSKAVDGLNKATDREINATAPGEELTLETSEDDRAALYEIYDGYTLRIADEGAIMALLRDHDAQAAHITTLTARLAEAERGHDAAVHVANERSKALAAETAAREAAETERDRAQARAAVALDRLTNKLEAALRSRPTNNTGEPE